MPYKNGNLVWNEIVLTKRQQKFIEKNWETMTNQQLADKLEVKITWLRMQLYQLGYKRMELEYWTEEQIKYLKHWYQFRGDKELAEIFNTKWPKQKGWTLKHIEKKRKYLNLKRTPKQLRRIKDRACKKGVYLEGLKKTWAKRGAASNGEIHWWLSNNNTYPFPYIKIDGKWERWNQWAWKKVKGFIPKGYNIVWKSGTLKFFDNSSLKFEHLEMIDNAELSRRNSEIGSKGLSDNYVAGLLSHGDPELRQMLKKQPQFLETKRKQLLLNRIIHEQTSIPGSTSKHEG